MARAPMTADDVREVLAAMEREGADTSARVRLAEAAIRIGNLTPEGRDVYRAFLTDLAAADEITIPLADLDAWEEFAALNRDAIEEQYGSVAKALQHARDGGLTLGGGAAPIVRVYFVE